MYTIAHQSCTSLKMAGVGLHTSSMSLRLLVMHSMPQLQELDVGCIEVPKGLVVAEDWGGCARGLR
jgi:hypothetical protein